MAVAMRVGNAPCSWGVVNFHEGGETAGYATVLDEIRETGYEGTELGDEGFMPTDPVRLREELAKRDLAMIGSFVPVALKEPDAHAGGAELAVRVARLLAAVTDAPRGERPVIVLSDDCGRDSIRNQYAGRVTPEMGLSEAEWRVLARGADLIARAVWEETGLRTVFHPHCAGFVETPEEIVVLMERTDPNMLGLALDTGHWSYGAGRNDPSVVLELLARVGERVWHVHFKDCEPAVADEARTAGREYNDAVGRGVFCDLGQGLVDFPAVKAWLDRAGYDGWIVVEQDVLPGMGSPKESARRNREYLASIGL
jgi:inosose dehydratase